MSSRKARLLSTLFIVISALSGCASLRESNRSALGKPDASEHSRELEQLVLRLEGTESAAELRAHANALDERARVRRGNTSRIGVGLFLLGSAVLAYGLTADEPLLDDRDVNLWGGCAAQTLGLALAIAGQNEEREADRDRYRAMLLRLEAIRRERDESRNDR